MIAVDTNILVHAHRPDLIHHQVARRCLEKLAEAVDTWSIPWPCLHEFLSVVTRPKAFTAPTPLPVALAQIDSWLSSPSIVVLEETKDHWNFLKETLLSSHVIGGAIHDARIATICLEHGVRELWTADRDFSRFRALATFNPFEDDRVHETAPAYGAILRARAAGRRRSLHRAT